MGVRVTAQRCRAARHEAASRPIFAGGDVKIVLLVVTKRPQLAEHVVRNIGWQTVKPGRVVVCTARADYDPTPFERTGVPFELVHDREGRILGSLRNLGVDAACHGADASTLVCSFDDDDLYGPSYLEGIADAWRKHPGAMIIGRSSWRWQTVHELPTVPPDPDPTVAGGMVAGVAGATISIPVAVWRALPYFRYPAIHIGEDIALQKIAARHKAIVSAYLGDFVALRHAVADHEHTSPPPAAPPAPRAPQRAAVTPVRLPLHKDAGRPGQRVRVRQVRQ